MPTIPAPLVMLAARMVQKMPNTIATTEPTPPIIEGPRPGLMLFIGSTSFALLDVFSVRALGAQVKQQYGNQILQILWILKMVCFFVLLRAIIAKETKESEV